MIDNLKLNIERIELKAGNYQRLLIDQANLEFQAGKVYGLVGENGSGKSTLLRAIVGLNQGDSIKEIGTLSYGDMVLNLGSRSVQNLSREDFQYFFQQYDTAFNPRKKVGYYLRRYTNSDESRITEVLGLYGLSSVEHIIQAFPHQLSGGEKQRVAIAIAHLKSVEVLLLDEPFASLDAENIELIEKLIERRKIENKITIITSHILEPLYRVCDIYFRINQHKVEIASPARMKPFTLKPSRQANTQKLISLEDVSFHFEEAKPLIQEINFDIYQEDIILLTGKSGSGKSTLLKLISGQLIPTSGIIYDHLTGKEIHNLSTNQSNTPYSILADATYMNKLIQYVPQDQFNSFPPFETVNQILKDISSGQETVNLKKLFLNMTGFESDIFDKRMHQLSGGYRQLLMLFITTTLQPKVLLLDEIFSALSKSNEELALKYLIQLQKENQMAMIFASHQIQQLSKYITKHISL